MADIALYRKYRPIEFSEVLGQEHIVKAIEGALALGRISHAYLFSGSRGTGKTSVARIFAKVIGVSQNDIYEIDAASHTGVDDIRALNEAIHTLPFESKYKVYILDEAHMLSKSAFNALLKTLEEPPAHVIFILATTEEEKLPETVISRCQVHRFKKPGHGILTELVLRIAKKEQISISRPAAELIALLGDGSFRDTQGTLQKIMSATADRTITPEEVETITGAPRAALLNNFLAAIGEGKVPPALEALHKASLQNVDMEVFIRLVLRKLRFVLLIIHAPELVKDIEAELSPDDFLFVTTCAKKRSPGFTPDAVLSLLNAYDFVGIAAIPELPIELAVLELCNRLADKTQKKP